MIDYDATLQKFFDEVIKWLEKTRLKAKDKHALAKIERAIEEVRIVAAAPQKYADPVVRAEAGLSNDWVFINDKIDPTVYHKYASVLWALNDLFGKFDYQREQAQEKLLRALYAVKYKNSTNILKDLSYPFISPTRFAVKVDLQKRK